MYASALGPVALRQSGIHIKRSLYTRGTTITCALITHCSVSNFHSIANNPVIDELQNIL